MIMQKGQHKVYLKRSPFHTPDAFKIMEVVRNHGYKCNLDEAEKLWQVHSNSLCANWLDLPANLEGIWGLVEPYIGEYDGLES